MSNDKSFLGKEPINKLLFKLSMPAVIGMLIMTLYNVVDAIFIGKYVGSLGLAGVAIVFPFFLFVIAVAQGLGIGASSIISRKFGEDNTKYAQQTFGNFISLIILFSVISTILGLIFSDKILFLLGSTQTILPYAKPYFQIIIFGLFFQIFTAASNNVIRAQGDAKIAMSVMMIGGILNLILDFLFIVVLNLGISGAAYATVIANMFSFSFSIYYFISKKSLISFSLEYLYLKTKIVSEMISIGASSFARQSSMGLLGVIMNNSLKFYGGDLTIAVYGIIFRIFMILMMPAMGILQGSLPIIGYNYGAKKFKRVKETLILSIKSSTLVISTFYLLIMVFPIFFVGLFTNESELLGQTITALKIVILCFPLIAFQTVAGGYFQAIGKKRLALVLSLLRQVFLLIPLVLLLPNIFGLLGIWISFPISDLIATMMTIFILKKEFKILDK